MSLHPNSRVYVPLVSPQSGRSARPLHDENAVVLADGFAGFCDTFSRLRLGALNHAFILGGRQSASDRSTGRSRHSFGLCVQRGAMICKLIHVEGARLIIILLLGGYT